MDDQTLRAGAQARLKAVRDRILALSSEISSHEQALKDLRAQLPELQFEEAAMRFIVDGAQAPAAAVARRKLSRPELIAAIKDRMSEVGGPLEVEDLHAYLEHEAGIDLGSNARNYLCGVLSRNKNEHFVNHGKGEWWLAGHDPS